MQLKIEILILLCSNPLLCYLSDSFAVEPEYLFIINSNLPKILSRMVDYSYYTFEDGRLRTRGLHRHDFPLLLWMPLCRLAMGTRFPSNMGGSTRSTTYSAARSTSISYPTSCFLMGAYGPHGSSGMTCTLPWRRMLTWRSPSCAHRTCLPLWGHLSRYT
jgi:hypothetical protein